MYEVVHTISKNMILSYTSSKDKIKECFHCNNIESPFYDVVSNLES